MFCGAKAALAACASALSAVNAICARVPSGAASASASAPAATYFAIFITTYNKPYAAVWNFQPLATGTAILFATLLTALILRVSPKVLASAFAAALRQTWLPAVTTMLIVGLAYLMNYSGMAYTLGVGVASLVKDVTEEEGGQARLELTA